MNLLLLVLTAFAADPGEVTLPLQQYQDLYNKATKPPPEVPPAAPRDYTLDRAVYTGTAVGEGDDAFASFKVVIKGQVLKQKGWTTIPLLNTSAALKKATFNGKDAPLFIQSDSYNLLTNTSGAFTIELEFGVSVQSADGETGMSLKLAPTGATELSFTVSSAEPVTFEVPNARGQVITKTNNVYRLDAAIPANSPLVISWKRQVTEANQAVAQAARIYAESQVLAGVGEGVMQCVATINYTVLHQGVDSFRVQLPKDVTVVDVKGAGLRDWSLEADGTLAVALNYAAEGAYRLTIEYERAITGEVPLPKVLGVAREKTYVGVDARSAVELVAGTASGAVPIDVRELPPAILGLTDFPVLLAYKARGGDVRLPLEVKTHPDVAMLVTLVDAAMADVLVTPEGRRMVHMQYAVRNNRNQFLKLQMPEGAEIWSATVAGRPVKVGRSEAGVLVPLVRSDTSSGALSGFLVDLVYVEGGSELTVGKGELKVELPKVNAPSSMVQLTVYTPLDLAVKKKSDEGSLRHVDWFSASPQIPQLAPEVAQRAQMEMNVTGNAQAATLGQGVDPVNVTVPLSGNVRYFEKTLALDELLWVSFDYTYKPKKM